MPNITQIVWDIISNDVSIRKDLIRNLINIRALAKYIIKTHNLNASLDSVISAIRRFESDDSFEKQFNLIKEVLTGSKLSTRTNVCCLTMTNTPDNLEYVSKAIHNGSVIKDEALRVSKGHEHIKLIFTQDHLEEVRKNVEKILSEEVGLAEVNIYLPEKTKETKGVFARITNEIANHDINVIDSVICWPELILLVSQRDLLQAHEAIYKLIS